MIEVVVGDRIPLILQVHDANKELDVTAILYLDTGKEYVRTKLPHVQNGLYMSMDEVMPDAPYLLAQYFTNKPEDYEVPSDTFKSVPKVEAQEKMLVGEVVHETKSDQFIQGEIQ